MFPSHFCRWPVAVGLGLGVASTGFAQTKRPMTFMDVQLMNQAGSAAISPNRQRVLYTLSVPDWKEARRTTDVWLVSATQGASSARQLTFTKDKNETSPTWSADGSYFVFSSNRDAAAGSNENQLYLMHADGGEARKITDAKDGVGAFAFTNDGLWLVYSVGKNDEQQLWRLPARELASGGDIKGTQLTKHPTPVGGWDLSLDGKLLFFRARDTVDQDAKNRVEKKFNVAIRNEDQPLYHLWLLDLATTQTRRLTGGVDYSVGAVSLSDDGRWAGFRGSPNDRYKRTVTESGNYDDLYLLEVGSGKIERLTTNDEIGEGNLAFSPDAKWIAFSAPNDFSYSRDPKIYVRETAAAAAPLRKLGDGYDGGLSVGWWSKDGKIYFNDGIRVTGQVLSLDVASGAVTQVTNEKAVMFATRDERTGLILVSYADPASPTSLYLVKSESDLGNKAAWVRLTNPNPQVATFALGSAEEYSWKSKDGKMVSGVLLKPAGFASGRRYPLIVQIHGGPAGADLLSFNGGYGSQIYAGAGYAVLMPNYRGSSNYGERHRMETAGIGKYFDRGFEDIMTGVDQLIADGIAHPDSLGAMGWSAGGHYSNWILTHTDRFKAISSGAGTVNWISMYAQSDIQRNRQWYMGGDLPYDNFDAYWRVSPLKYIKAAKTPTLIHVVDGDPRVPRPQSEELHMALKKLHVPTELFVYPGASHGIPDPRNQLTKAVVEFNWFEKYIRGKPEWFKWRELLKTVEDSTTAPTKPIP
jgi:dipeptidyl aminopeptidase/acylaminoacyl peptidase